MSALKTQSTVKKGDIISPFLDVDVRKDGAVVVNGLESRHSSTKFNAMVICGYLVALEDFHPDESVSVNINQFTYHLDDEVLVGDERVGGFQALPEDAQQALYRFADETVREAAVRDGFVPNSNEDHVTTAKVVVAANTSANPAARGQLVTLSKEPVAVGDTAFASRGITMPFPLRTTVALPLDKHLRLTGGAEFLQHSCQPNLVIEINGDTVRGVAIRPIAEGELLTYNYLTTEWDVARPFRCQCNVFSCYGLIQGFKHLEPEQQQHLLPTVSQAVRNKYTAPAQSTATLHLLGRDALLAPNRSGELTAITSVPAGTVLTAVQRYRIGVRELFADNLRLPHACTPNTAIIEGRLCALTTLRPGERLTINVALLAYHTPVPFACDCGAASCVKLVEGFKGLSDELKDQWMNLTEPSVRLEATKAGYCIRSSSSYVTVRDNGAMGQATFAAKPIVKGTRFFRTTGLVIPFPTVYTILLAENKHLLFAGGAQCLAHACDPNVRIVVDPSSSSFECVALRDIADGDLIAFNYLTTEWDMNTPFPCVCGTSTCFRNIRGFRHVNDDDRQRLWHNATPAIRTAACKSLPASALGSMDRSMITVDASGLLRAADDVASGSILFPIQRWNVEGSWMVLDDAHVRHSCEPNVFLVLGKLVAARVIPSGEELRVNLNATYYRLPTPFSCTCSAKDCVGNVSGFADVPIELKHRLMIFVDPDVRVLATKDGYRLTSDSSLISINDNGDMGQTTFAATSIRKGTRFFRSHGIVIPFPTVYTILLSPGRNLLFAGGAHCLAHSCDPNVQVVVEPSGNSFDLVALRDIQEGEMVSFNYLTTEWDMNVPFPCLCGAANCFHMIRGFKHLSDTERKQLAPLATGAVKELAGLHSQIQLPKLLAPTQQHMIAATSAIPRGTCLFECANMELHPTHLTTGQFLVKHSLASNTVFVEGCLISLADIAEGETLTVNMCYMVYDMTKLFPETYVTDNRGFKFLDEAVKQYDLYLCEPAVRAQAMRDGWIVVPTNPILTVRPNGDMGQTAYAVEAIPSGTLLFHTGNKGLIVPFPTMYTICVGEKRHLLFGDAAECIAHSCDPNVHVVVRSDETLEFRTCKDVAAGGMMSFCYSTTEWMMNSTFPCLCGSDYCGKYIRGFQNLSDADRQRLWPLASDYIRGLANGTK